MSSRQSSRTIHCRLRHTFASGDTPQANAVLGQLDPTLLLNGAYQIRGPLSGKLRRRLLDCGFQANELWASSFHALKC